MSIASDALNFREEVLRFWFGIHGPGFADQLARLHRDMPLIDTATGERHEPLSGEVLRLLYSRLYRQSTPTWVSRDMTQVLMAAAPSLPNFTLQSDDLITPDATVFFQGGLLPTDVNHPHPGVGASVDALSWTTWADNVWCLHWTRSMPKLGVWFPTSGPLWRFGTHLVNNDHRPIWVSPHIKGPEDKPLILKETVNAWVR